MALFSIKNERDFKDTLKDASQSVGLLYEACDELGISDKVRKILEDCYDDLWNLRDMGNRIFR